MAITVIIVVALVFSVGICGLALGLCKCGAD
jgi:hypothetical protein